MEEYDLLLIGSGAAANLGGHDTAHLKVALADGNPVYGGTCLNVGCIPTKMFVYPADAIRKFEKARSLGVAGRVDAVDWPGIRDRVFGKIDPLSEQGRQWRRGADSPVTLIEENVRFTGPRTLVTAGGREITAKNIVVGAGSSPRKLGVPGEDLPQIHDNASIMRLERFPGRLLVVGGGYIAAEFSHVFASYGADVTLAVRGEALLADLDATVSERFTALARRQWEVLDGTTVREFKESAGGVTAVLSRGGSREEREFDAVLVAIGRVPNAASLTPEAAGLDVREDGRLAVDSHQRILSGGKPVEGLWALGDVSTSHPLRHVANYESRTVLHNILTPGKMRESVYDAIPAAVFSNPQVGTVGMTERQAREAGHDVGIGHSWYSQTAYGWAMGDRDGFCKVVVDKASDRILGGHVMGENAAVLVQLLVQAISLGTTVEDMLRGQLWIHPSQAEVVELALYKYQEKNS